MGFELLWNSAHGAGAWEQNPIVVVICFRPVMSNIDKLPKDMAV